ncbi:MAG TPA: TonB-dependent receptor plug domain-containing protein, partial [Ferruginibacter sp.]|nr:TonB-dependent receptor plug domain-containing protein [Ferruginibacter sp.]
MYIRCLSLLLLLSSVVNAQQAIQVQLLDASNGRPVAGVHFSIGDSISKVSDRNGRLSCRLFNGVYSADIVSLAFQPLQQTIVVPGPDSLLFSLIPVIDTLPDVAVIASTRIHQRMEQAPLKVEVLGKEELNEESLIKPGNISSLLSDVSGVQLQQLSAVSGNANLRLQGLDGRYTQVLRDGMPLFDGFSSGFSLIQIPPLDLRQIELIKGSASTLYGGGAIGGLVNLISNTPAQHPEATLVTNY